jgi:endonuclease/exonuclease/phosphatase family metal-dependent hydrolase
MSGRTWLIRLVLVLLFIFGGRFHYLLNAFWSPVRADTDTWEFKLLTFNLNYNNYHAAEIADLIRRQKPDIVALQELNRKTAADLQAQFAEEYPFFLVGEGETNQQGLFSRYPLIMESGLPAPFSRHLLQAVVQTPAGPMTIMNVHPRVAINQLLWEFQRDSLTNIAQRAAAVSGPLLVLGDFNTTDQAENYHLLADQFTDLYQVVGRGFGFTFPAKSEPAGWLDSSPSAVIGPFLRIDLIFASNHFSPVSVKVLTESANSDHHPVVAVIRLTPDQAH